MDKAYVEMTLTISIRAIHRSMNEKAASFKDMISDKENPIDRSPTKLHNILGSHASALIKQIRDPLKMIRSICELEGNSTRHNVLRYNINNAKKIARPVVIAIG